MFGEQVSLNYKGSSTYNTHIGGCFSLLTYLFIFYFLATRALGLLEFENTMNVLVFETNLIQNPKNLTFSEGEMQVAAKLTFWHGYQNTHSNDIMDRYWRV